MTSPAEYHAIRALSHSALESYFEGGPALYFGRHLAAETDDRWCPPRPPTDEMAIGSALDFLVTEGLEKYERSVAIWRGGKTRDGKDSVRRNTIAYKEFEDDARAEGRTIISESDHHTVQGMAAALHSNDTARKLFFERPGESQHPLRWELPDGRPCKALLDRLVRPVIVDLKTTHCQTFEQVVRQAYSYGYHRKADWYRRGYFANFGETPRDFLFVSVRSCRPYLVWVWRVDPLGEEVAQIEIDMALDDIAKRQETDDWEPMESKGVVFAEMPPWSVSSKVKTEIERRQFNYQPSEDDAA